MIFFNAKIGFCFFCLYHRFSLCAFLYADRRNVDAFRVRCAVSAAIGVVVECSKIAFNQIFLAQLFITI